MNHSSSRPGSAVSLGQYLTLELDSRNETVQHIAQCLGCTENTLQQVLDGRLPLTPELAHGLQRCWGISMKLLLDLQYEHQQYLRSAGPISAAEGWSSDTE